MSKRRTPAEVKAHAEKMERRAAFLKKARKERKTVTSFKKGSCPAIEKLLRF